MSARLQMCFISLAVLLALPAFTWAQTTASAPASAPAEVKQEAPASWPPGLVQESLGPDTNKAMGDLGLKIWGFVESGFTGRLTGGQDPLPLRGYDARRPNNLRLNQLQLTVERAYDANKNFDLGGRIDGLFGGDAMLTHELGLLDHAGRGNGDAWTDVVQAYGQLWFKTGKESGLEVTFGKFLELAGSEVAEATYNALYSHSFIYGFAEPTTHTGVVAKYIVNPQVFGYFGLAQGWDVFEDNNHAHTYLAGGGWSSKDQVGGHARTQVLLNIITGPEQPNNSRDFRTLTDIIVNRWWSEKLSESLNFDWVTEENVPGIGRANAYGPAHYLTYICNDYVSATWRAEWFRDDGGSRTGIDGSFFESTWGLGITPCPKDRVFKNLILRPELRWDFADVAAFGADRHNQLTLAMDVIFKF